MRIAFIISCIVVAILIVIVIVQHYSIKKLSGTTTTTTATTTTSSPVNTANQKGSIPFGDLVKSTQDTYKGFEMKVNVTPTS